MSLLTKVAAGLAAAALTGGAGHRRRDDQPPEPAGPEDFAWLPQRIPGRHAQAEPIETAEEV